MKSIWKFEIETTDVQRVSMPKGAEILTVQTQNEAPCLWAQFDVRNKDTFEERLITIHGTGHIIADITDNKERVYIGTYQLRGGSLVFHVFELRNKVIETGYY